MHQEYLEEQLLNQICVLFEGEIFPFWIRRQTLVHLKIGSCLFPLHQIFIISDYICQLCSITLQRKVRERERLQRLHKNKKKKKDRFSMASRCYRFVVATAPGSVVRLVRDAEVIIAPKPRLLHNSRTQGIHRRASQHRVSERNEDNVVIARRSLQACLVCSSCAVQTIGRRRLYSLRVLGTSSRAVRPSPLTFFACRYFALRSILMETELQ